MKLTTYTDGGSRGNPGPAATGVVIKDEEGKILFSYGEYLGKQTNNFAEYTAIITALKKAYELGATEVECIADSKLVVEQLKGNWKVKEPTLQKLFLEGWNLMQKFKKVSLKHTLREGNSEADAEVNKILDAEEKKSTSPIHKPINAQIPAHAKCVYAGSIFEVYRWDQEMYDKSKVTFEKIVRTPSVDVLLVHDEKIMILYQEQISKPMYPSFPGGRLEKNEDPLEGAQRELLEETGWGGGEFELWRNWSIGGNKVYFENSIFITRSSQKIAEPTPDSGERFERIEFVSFEEFLELCRVPNFLVATNLKFEMYEALLDPKKKEKMRQEIFGE